MATNTTTGRERPTGNDRRRVPLAVPPAYPDPETWRRFGLFRRQLRYSERRSEQLQSAGVERQ